MWRKLLTLAQTVLTLASDVERNHSEIKEIRRDLLNLTLLVQRISDEVRSNSRYEASEREKLVLQLENELLKLEKRLLLAGDDRHANNTSTEKLIKKKQQGNS